MLDFFFHLDYEATERPLPSGIELLGGIMSYRNHKTCDRSEKTLRPMVPGFSRNTKSHQFRYVLNTVMKLCLIQDHLCGAVPEQAMYRSAVSDTVVIAVAWMRMSTLEYRCRVLFP